MNRKTLKRFAVAAPVAAALLLSPPAKADGPFTFVAGAATATSVTRQAFIQDRCSDRVFDSPINGSDGRIVKIGHYAGRDVIVNWQGASAGWLNAFFYSGSCGLNLSPSNTRSTAPGAWRMRVPAGTAFLVVDGLGVGNVSFTVTPA